MNIELEADAVVVLVGPMGSGKSTFCEHYFRPHDIVATDAIREQLTGDFQSQKANDAVFDILFATVQARAKMGTLTVIDSTGTGSVINHALKSAQEFNRPLYGFIFGEVPPEELTEARMAHRMKVIDVYHKQIARIARTTYPKAMKLIQIPTVDRYKTTLTIASPLGWGTADLDPQKAYTVIPDLHGCYEALLAVQDTLSTDHMGISLGDIVDRGPSSYKTFQLIKNLTAAGKLISTTSNHDYKFYRWCKKYLKNDASPDARVDVHTQGMVLANGLEKTVGEFFTLSKSERDVYAQDFIAYYDNCKPVLYLDKPFAGGGIERNIFVHAGVTPEVFRQRNFSSFDLSAFMFQENESVHDIARMVENGVPPDKEIMTYVCHCGHDYGYHGKFRTQYEVTYSLTVTLVKHDIGLGKRDDVDYAAIEFYTIE